MHSYLKTVGFSQITRRSEIKEIIRDVIASYDEKVCVENHPEGVFVQFSKNYGCDCGISVCGQYDESGEFHVEYYFPFFRGTGITSKEKVTVERHTDKESYAGACDDLRIGVTMIFYLQNLAEYMQEKYKGLKDPGDRPVTVSGLALRSRQLAPWHTASSSSSRRSLMPSRPLRIPTRIPSACCWIPTTSWRAVCPT